MPPSTLYACIGLQCSAPTDPRPPPIIQAREEEEDDCDAEAALGTLTIECSLLALEAIEEAGKWLAGGGHAHGLSPQPSFFLIMGQALSFLLLLAGGASQISWNCHRTCAQCFSV